MFYGVPGGLSGAQWGTQDANGVWSGWANPAPVQQAAYDPGAGAAFGGAADAYTGDPSAYAAQMTPPQVQTPSPALPPPIVGASFGGGGASFGGAPAAAPAASGYTGLPDGMMGHAALTPLGSAPVGGMGSVTAGVFGGSDPAAFMRSLDWSPQNAANATRQMTDAMARNGWTSEQMGASLGFTGQQMDDHIAKYGAPSTGAQLSGAGGPGMSGYGSMPQNPYLPAIAGDITRRTTDMMNAGIRQARGSAIAAGGFGGSAQGIMEGKAISGAADNLAGQLGGLYGSAWNQDQSRDLQRYAADQGFFTSQRGQDLQQAGLGASLLGQGLGMQWAPLQGASGLYTGYTGFGNTSTPGQGGGWQGLLGGALGAAQLARNFGWFAPSNL